MASKNGSNGGMSFPVAAMLVSAVASAVIVGFSFEVITVWPQPVSVEPYFNGWTGAVWGAAVGAVMGFVLGFLTDEKHFSKDS